MSRNRRSPQGNDPEFNSNAQLRVEGKIQPRLQHTVCTVTFFPGHQDKCYGVHINSLIKMQPKGSFREIVTADWLVTLHQLFFLVVYIIVVLLHGCVLQDLRKPFAFCVCMVPEVEEEEDEDDAIQSNDVDEYGVQVRTVFHEVVLANMTSYHDKLDLRRESTSKNNSVSNPTQIGLVGSMNSKRLHGT